MKTYQVCMIGNDVIRLRLTFATQIFVTGFALLNLFTSPAPVQAHRMPSLRFIMAHCQRGDGEIRTLDPLLARQVLSQLSYTPSFDFVIKSEQSFDS